MLALYANMDFSTLCQPCSSTVLQSYFMMKMLHATSTLADCDELLRQLHALKKKRKEKRADKLKKGKACCANKKTQQANYYVHAAFSWPPATPLKRLKKYKD